MPWWIEPIIMMLLCISIIMFTIGIRYGSKNNIIDNIASWGCITSTLFSILIIILNVIKLIYMYI